MALTPEGKEAGAYEQEHPSMGFRNRCVLIDKQIIEGERVCGAIGIGEEGEDLKGLAEILDASKA
ncbi:MAG: hypothetical protein ACKVHP_01715 [Verrucomicrobiales bacterium]